MLCQLSYTADHPKTLGQVVVAYKAFGVVSYARCTSDAPSEAKALAGGLSYSLCHCASSPRAYVL